MTSETKIKVIINPNADLGRAWQSSAELRKIFDKYGHADWTGTVYPVHAQEIAREAAERGYELVIAVGGDGTIHEVVNGLMSVPKESRPQLGIVPYGSGNDFAHAVGMDSRPNYAVRQIFNGQVKAVDIGRITDDSGRLEYWTNTVGVGFDSTVVMRFQQMTHLRGFAAYLAAVLQTVAYNLDFPHMQVTTDQESWEDDVLMLVSCNGNREGGGFLIAPEAKPDDGVLQFAWIEKVSRLRLLQIIPDVMKGTHERYPEVRIGKFKTLHIQSDRPLNIHTDGEIFANPESNVREINIEILPGAIEIVG
jgi:YegS/Rv2252/BmrU family lipid kinase